MIYVAGVDEVGRGPLAGPVVAAAVILDPNKPIAGLTDSKLIKAPQRTRLARTIEQQAIAVGLGMADVAEIDSLNILQATFLAMRRAVQALAVRPGHLEIDGNRAPSLEDLGFKVTAECFVKGDLTRPSISAASIVAKVWRDQYMVETDQIYPGYGFASHKGYGTAVHLRALRALGPCAVHRQSFAPVRECR